MHKYHTLYTVKNIINDRYYIGIHSTNNLDDGYMGSGTAIKLAIEKYGNHNFEKSILYIFDDREMALAKERELVTEELIKDEMCYNLKTGGSSGFIYSDEWIEIVSERAKKNHNLTINSDKAKEKRAIANRRRAESGEYSSPERREKIRKTILKQKDEISERVKKDWSDPDHAEMRKKRMRESKANAPMKTCPCCGMQMKANLTRHIKAKHPHFELN